MINVCGPAAPTAGSLTTHEGWIAYRSICPHPVYSPMIKTREKTLVSACLLGVKCRYDGRHAKSGVVDQLAEEMDLIPVCPEQLGGLSTPRPAVQLEGGDGHTLFDGGATVREVESGDDRTREMLAGAEAALTIARFHNVRRAYLHARSPSCGCGMIYREGALAEGDGVTTALLKRNGITVETVDPKAE